MTIEEQIKEYETQLSQIKENMTKCEADIRELNKRYESLNLDQYYLTGAIQALRRAQSNMNEEQSCEKE